MFIRSKILATVLLLVVANAFAVEKGLGTAKHPTPKKPTLLKADLLTEFKSKITLPPKLASDLQQFDEKILKELQATRTADDCKRAEFEVYVSLANFFGKPYSMLTEAETTKLAAFFDKVRNDADFYIQKLKKEFPRKRPFLYMAELKPCVPLETTGAYPSGHATLARLYALILTDFFPDEKAALEERADQIGKDRVLSGMHHPTDVQAGKQLGEMVYEKLKQSASYQKEFKKLSEK